MNPVIVLLGCWFVLAVALGVSGVYSRASAVAVAATVWGLLAALVVLRFVWQKFADWVAGLELDVLVALHLTRFVGAAFLALYAARRLPFSFAVPGGIGDLAVACGAGLILIYCLPPTTPSKRRALVAWNVIGLLDILMVVFSALRAGLRDWQSMAALRAFPMSLIPTFLVPLIIGSHLEIARRLALSRPASLRAGI
jgi:hypothetical protein